MTIKELISKLEVFPQDAEVFTQSMYDESTDSYTEFVVVSVIKDRQYNRVTLILE